ncbi:hypothetical protein AAAC51_08110 [Priestia megaterium]
MNTLYQQMQQDVMGTANNMMTQMVCQEKGIDYNQLMYQAQQQHLNNIMQAEQQRQMMQVVKRHYQGNGGSFISKIKDVFSPEPTTPFMPMPNMFPGQSQPTQPTYVHQTQVPMQPQQMSPQETATMMYDQLNRVDAMEQKLNGMEHLLGNIAQALGANGQQQLPSQQQQNVQYQQQPPLQFQAQPGPENYDPSNTKE